MAQSRGNKNATVNNKMSENINQLWKTALYIRLSKEDGNDVSYSVKNQEQRLRDFLNKNTEEFELIKVLIDDGYTGTDSNRDAFQHLLDDIRTKNINCVIVKDPSRLSRNYIEAGHYMEQLFVNLNVRFISLELPALDSYKCPEQMNSIMVPIQNVINDDFCRQTSIKIRGVFDMKRSNGEFIGAFAPYGYRKDPQDRHSLLIDEEAAQVVKDIFEWFVKDGMSKAGIVRKLNGLGIDSPAMYKKKKGMNYNNPNCNTNNGLWSSRTVSEILQNPTYLGHMVQGRQKVKSYKIHTKIAVPQEDWFYVKNKQEPLVTQKVYDKAGVLQKRNVRCAPGKNELYLFSGFVKCADCGKSMTRRTSKNLVYYACRTYTEQSRERCTRHSVRADRMEKAVLEVVRSQIALDGSVDRIADKLKKNKIVSRKTEITNQRLKKCEQELLKNEDITDSLYIDWKCGDITKEEYGRMKNKLTEERVHLIQVKYNLQEECKKSGNEVRKDQSSLTCFLNNRNILKLDRGIMAEMIDVIYVHEGGNFTMVFNFEDQLK